MRCPRRSVWAELAQALADTEWGACAQSRTRLKRIVGLVLIVLPEPARVDVGHVHALMDELGRDDLGLPARVGFERGGF